MRRAFSATLVAACCFAAAAVAQRGSGGRGTGPTITTGGAFYCYQNDGHRASLSQPHKATPFSGSPVIEVTIDRRGSKLSGTVEREIANELVEAIGLWHYACEWCDRTSVAAVRVGNRLLLNQQVGVALASTDLSPMPKGTSGFQQLNYFEGHEFLFGYLGARGMSVTFEETPADSPALQRLAAATSANVAPAVARLREGLIARKGVGHIRIVFTGNRTSCGDDPNIVACALTDQGVELNVAGFLFSDRTGLLPLVGTGTRRVNLLQVLLHETGHWLGLPHANDSPNIMANSVDRMTCLNNDNVKTLAVARELDWPDRLHSAGALYYKATSGGH